jgi:hypothetical protein
MALTTLRLACWSEIEPLLRAVPQYRNSSTVSIQPMLVRLEDLRPLCRLVRTYRLSRVEEQVAAYRAQGLELFQGAWARQEEGVEALVTPPIVESHGQHRAIIGGLHRLYCAHRLRLQEVWVALVGGGLEELPADVLEWSDLEITDRHVPRSAKFRNLDETKFRELKRWIGE